MKLNKIEEVWNSANLLFKWIFGLSLSKNFATMATWRNDFSPLLSHHSQVEYYLSKFSFPLFNTAPRTSLNQSSIPISWSWLLLLLLLLLIDSEEGYLGEDFKTFLVTGKFIWHCQQSFLKRTLEPGYEWFTVLKKSMAMDINLLPVIFSQIEMVSDVQM